jgi:predicted secreted Zn-dependent protease
MKIMLVVAALLFVVAPAHAQDRSERSSVVAVDGFACPGGSPVEIDFTVAEPNGQVVTITEDAMPLPAAMIRKQEVFTNGLNVAEDPVTHDLIFYPAHRVLRVLFRRIC